MGVSLNVWIPVHTKYTCILVFDICVFFFHLYKSLFPYCELTPSGSWGRNAYSLVMELFDIWQDALTTIDLPGRTWEKRMTVDTNDLSSWNGRVLKARRKLTQNWQNFLTLKFEAIYPRSFSPILAHGAQEPWDDQYFSPAPSPSKHIQVGFGGKQTTSGADGVCEECPRQYQQTGMYPWDQVDVSPMYNTHCS